MARTFIGVREVDEETFRKFKALAIQEKLNLGIALTIAMKKLLEERKKSGQRKILGPQLAPFNWGKGTEKASNEVDEAVYGKKR